MMGFIFQHHYHSFYNHPSSISIHSSSSQPLKPTSSSPSLTAPSPLSVAISPQAARMAIVESTPRSFTGRLTEHQNAIFLVTGHQNGIMTERVERLDRGAVGATTVGGRCVLFVPLLDGGVCLLGRACRLLAVGATVVALGGIHITCRRNLGPGPE